MCILKMSEIWWCRARALTHSLSLEFFSHIFFGFFFFFILFYRLSLSLLIWIEFINFLVYASTLGVQRHNSQWCLQLQHGVKKVKNEKKEVLTLIYISIEYWCSCSYSCQYMIAPNIYIFVWRPFVLFGSFSLLKFIYFSICVLFI